MDDRAIDRDGFLMGGNIDTSNTLRDTFAAAALTGLLADGIPRIAEANTIAISAYIFADAMMEARKKK